MSTTQGDGWTAIISECLCIFLVSVLLAVAVLAAAAGIVYVW